MTSLSPSSVRSGSSSERMYGRVLHVVRGQVGEEALDEEHRVLLAVGGEVRDAGGGGVGQRAAQLLEGDRLVRHGLDHVRPGDEHIRRVLDHDDEVGEGGGIDRAAGRRPHDHADLRNDARGQCVAEEDVRVAAEREDALLDARAARVVQANDRRAVLHRQIHDLADLFRVRLAQRAADHGEVLREDVHQAPVDRAVPGDHAVAQDLARQVADVAPALDDEAVQLGERALVQEQLEPLARGQLALGMLRLDALLAAAQTRCVFQVTQRRYLLLVCHKPPYALARRPNKRPIHATITLMTNAPPIPSRNTSNQKRSGKMRMRVLFRSKVQPPAGNRTS